jgi:hypothetical protein
MFARHILFIARLAFLTLTWITAGSVSVIAQTPPPDTRSEPITGSITGRVVSESGQGVANAMVYARASSAFFQRATATDSEGSFKFEGLDSALYGFTVSAPSYIMPARDPDAEPVYYRLSDSVTLNLIKGGVITGTVLSSTGDPVVQVGVRAVLVRYANGQAPKGSGFQSQRATDDRGIYRIYGLPPGTYLVFAGGRSSFGGAYDEDAPTYAPSSTRDSAAQISVSNGDEITGVDIRYRGEAGHSITGTLTGMSDANLSSSLNVLLTQVANGISMAMASSYTPPGGRTFSFYGLADGDYDLNAQTSTSAGDSSASEPRRITVKGADITGIELNIKPLGSINGHVALAKSDVAECKNKRQPLLSEILITARRSEKDKQRELPRFASFFPQQGVPNQTGDFLIRNLLPGQYNFTTRFFAKYWYLKSIVRQTGATVPPAAKTALVNSQNDLARNGVTLKFSENVSRVIVNLAEGAASFHGRIKLETGQTLPARFFVYLVPAEKEAAEDVLRFFVSEVGSDGVFRLNNLPPGRYSILRQVSPGKETQSEMKLRLPDEMETRERLRRAAEAGKLLVELKPCQSNTDYQLQASFVTEKN